MPRNIIGELLSNIFIESLLVVLILFSPLIYGGVTNLPLTITELINFLVFFVFLFKLGLKGKFSLIRIPSLALFLFSLLIIFQLLPLPGKLLSFLSPNTVSLYRNFRITPTDIFTPPLHAGPALACKGGVGAGFTLSIYHEATLNLGLQFLSYLALFLAVLNYIDTEKKGRRLAATIIIAGFLYSLYGIVQRLSTPMREFSTFVNANHFAAYIEMLIPLSIVYSLISFSKSSRFIFVFIALVDILALFLSLSRGGIICFSISFLILLFILRLKSLFKKRMRLIIILLFGLSLFLGMISLRATVINELKSLLSGDVLSGRFKLFKDTLRIFRDFPLFGTGLGTFGEIFQKYKTFAFKHETSGPVVTYSFAHNEPLQILSETGILGFLLLFLFLFKYLKNVCSLWLKRKDPYAVSMTLGCLVGLFSIGLHSMFDFVFHIPANSSLFFIILALTYRVVYIKEPQGLLPIPELKIALPKFLKVILAVFLCLSFIFIESLLLKRYQAEARFGKIKEKKVSETGIDSVLEYKRILKEIDRAIALNPLNSLYLNKKAELLSELALKEDLEDELRQIENLKGQNEILRLAQKYYSKAIDLNPTKAEYHLRLGWLYSVLGKEDLIQKELQKALLLDPQNDRIQSYVNKFLEITQNK